MKLPFPEFRRKADQWVSRNLLWIVVGVCVLGLVVIGMVNHYGDQVEKAVDSNPPVSKKEAKAIEKKIQAAEDTKQAAIAIAIRHIKRADSSQRIATRAKDQADSLRTEYDQISASATGSLADIERALATYESPDSLSE